MERSFDRVPQRGVTNASRISRLPLTLPLALYVMHEDENADKKREGGVGGRNTPRVAMLLFVVFFAIPALHRTAGAKGGLTANKS